MGWLTLAAPAEINFEIFAQYAATSPPPKWSKFVLNDGCCPPNTKFHPSVQNFPCAVCSQQCTSHYLTLFTTQNFMLLPASLYQKDERALPGNLQSSKLLCLPPPLVVTSAVPLSAHPLLFQLCHNPQT
jgi:hypothetical protein